MSFNIVMTIVSLAASVSGIVFALLAFNAVSVRIRNPPVKTKALLCRI